MHAEDILHSEYNKWFQISKSLQYIFREETHLKKINTVKMYGIVALLPCTSHVLLQIVTGGCGDLSLWCSLSVCTSFCEVFGLL